MNIIEFDDRKFIVYGDRIYNEDEAKKCREFYEEHYPDFRLVKDIKRSDIYSTYLLCREISEAEYDEIESEGEDKVGQKCIEGTDQEDG